MRIAQVSPLFESVPPRLYGGTERVVSFLTDALVELGHDVTLFASGDSHTDAELVACWPRALRLEGRSEQHLAVHLLQMERVMKRRADFDVVHFHTDPLQFPLMRREPLAHFTTLHGRLDLPELGPLVREFREMPLVSVSNAQRAPMPWAPWHGTVHHGLPCDLFEGRFARGEYLAFLGRISPEKRVDRAIAIANRLQMPLRIAAKVDNADKRYFDETIKPLLDSPWVEFIGEIDERQKQDFLGRAVALLFPIDWPEPFGLVMIEAMACGTPVVAWRHGSVPEVIEPGLTGAIVEDLDAASQAVLDAAKLDRRKCRERFEQRFTAERMARDYLAIYQALMQPSALVQAA
ncbi:glycosyltransferase family 4 protein [Ideonella sp. DXS29W]|uniref:Glycosyltransferase family 4 protein n=1 Tax=Ideonella lacteola TaxID=2984193 RepID=A0ABU9BRL0_9BURK